MYRWKQGQTPSYYYTLYFLIMWPYVEKVSTYSQLVEAIKQFRLSEKLYELDTLGSEIRKEQTLETFL